jgi:hypothetical protein
VTNEPPISPLRSAFIRRIAALPIKPTARDYYVRWAGLHPMNGTTPGQANTIQSLSNHVPLRLSAQQLEVL